MQIVRKIREGHYVYHLKWLGFYQIKNAKKTFISRVYFHLMVINNKMSFNFLTFSMKLLILYNILVF